jgi:hypothetical protein
MIARLRVLLPFAFTMPTGEPLPPQDVEIPPYSARIYPPYLAAIDPSELSPAKMPVLEIAKAIVPAAPQASGRFVVDQKATVQANLFQIDFIKSSFDRRRKSSDGDPAKVLDKGDPSFSFAFDVLNNWINRYKYLARSTSVRPIRPGETFFSLEYLTDDEESLPSDPELFRLRTYATQSIQIDILDKSVWDQVGVISREEETRAWEVLLLDAPGMLPKIGPAIVLAYAALEAFIDWSLDRLVDPSKIPSLLWNWVNKRDGFWLRPRTAEQFDVILKSLTGKSLKDDQRLWILFRNLATARHSYVHEGRTRIGDEDVSLDQARELVTGAANIVAWVEGLLPVNLRRRELKNRYEVTIPQVIMVSRPVVQPSAENRQEGFLQFGSKDVGVMPK